MLINFQNYPKLERAVGRSGAKFIRRLDYWIGKRGKLMDGGGSHKWVFNTLDEWASQLLYSASTIFRVVHNLEKEGIILAKKFDAKQLKQVKYYTINYKELSAMLNIPKMAKTSQKSSSIQTIILTIVH